MNVLIPSKPFYGRCLRSLALCLFVMLLLELLRGTLKQAVEITFSDLLSVAVKIEKLELGLTKRFVHLWNVTVQTEKDSATAIGLSDIWIQGGMKDGVFFIPQIHIRGIHPTPNVPLKQKAPVGIVAEWLTGQIKNGITNSTSASQAISQLRSILGG